MQLRHTALERNKTILVVVENRCQTMLLHATMQHMQHLVGLSPRQTIKLPFEVFGPVPYT